MYPCRPLSARIDTFNATLTAISCAWLLLLLPFLLGCGSSGPARHEVTGIVLVDQQPAERVMVQFHAVDEALTGDDRYPVCLTDSQGKFRLGDQSPRPGALEGTYKVTFSWLSSPGLDATDKLAGAYANEGKSDFTVTVPTSGELLFELKAKR